MSKESSSDVNRVSAKQPYWMLYVAGIFGGIILLADALGFAPLERVTAKLAIALKSGLAAARLSLESNRGKVSLISLMNSLILSRSLFVTSSNWCVFNTGRVLLPGGGVIPA